MQVVVFKHNYMNINNKDIIQSYIMTTAKYDFSADEKRILLRLVETGVSPTFTTYVTV